MKRLALFAAAALQATACFAGSFFVNIAVLRADCAKVEAAVRNLGLTAFVVTDESRPGFSLVCDKRADEQDTGYGIGLAKKLSKETKSPVLYTLVHDSDILCLELLRGGSSVFSYDSWPGYFEGEDPVPEIKGLEAACAVFKVETEGLKATLVAAGSEEYVFAEDLLAAVLGYIGLPLYIAGAGYAYLKEDPDCLDGLGLTVTEL